MLDFFIYIYFYVRISVVVFVEILVSRVVHAVLGRIGASTQRERQSRNKCTRQWQTIVLRTTRLWSTTVVCAYCGEPDFPGLFNCRMNA